MLAVGPAQGQRRRNEKSLTNTFPFNSRSQSAGAHDHAHAHDHDHEHAHDHSPVSAVAPIRDARQGAGKDDVSLDIGSIAAAGERCIDKVNLFMKRFTFDNFDMFIFLKGCDG